MERDPTAGVAPIGQLPFFIQYLKLGHRFMPWVEDCPLDYVSNNAPSKIDVLGSLLLSVLSGELLASASRDKTVRLWHVKSVVVAW